MKIKILQEKLNQALTQAEKITGKDATLPILNNILLKAEKNSLSVLATNLETGISWKMLSKVEEEGVIAVPAQVFSGLVNSLPGGLVNIETDQTSILLTSERRKSNLKGLGAEEFPVLPMDVSGEFLTIKADIFCAALAQVVNFASLSSVKPEITGVYLSLKKEEIKIVATDSFRLGEKTISLKKQNPMVGEYSIIISLRAAKEIISIFGDKSGNVNIFFAAGQILIDLTPEDDQSQPQIQFVGRLIEGEFPDYQTIIPTSFAANIVFSKKEMLNHLKSAGIFSGKASEVNINVAQKEGLVTVSSQSSELGEYESELKPEKTDGKDIKITLNLKFLLDGLNSIKGDRCVFEFSTDDGPLLLKQVDDSGFVYVLMPIKKY